MPKGVRVRTPPSLLNHKIFLQKRTITLKIETTPHENHQVKIVAEFDADVFETYKRKAAKKISNQTKIPGFRPGKAPYEFIARMVGEGAIVEEAVDLLIDDQYRNVLLEANINPSGPGSLSEIVNMDPPTFAFLVPLQPDVDLGDYKSIRLEYVPEVIEESEVEDFLKRLQQNYASAEPVERPIENGDLVYIKVSGIDINVENDEYEILKETPVQFVIGDKTQDDNWPFENFANELLGLNEGDEKSLTHKFDEEADDEFKGKEVKFLVTVQSVKSLTLPELNDEFAKNLGQFDDLDSLKKAIRDQLESTKNQEYEDKYYTDLLEKIAAQATVKYPSFMVDEEIEHILQNLETNLKQQNMDLETYLKLVKSDREKYIEENVRQAAENRLVNSLIIDKYGQMEKIEIGKDDYETIVSETRMMLEEKPGEKGKKSKTSGETMNNMTLNAISRLYNQKTLARMKAVASGLAEIVDQPVEESIKPETNKNDEAEIETAESES